MKNNRIGFILFFICVLSFIGLACNKKHLPTEIFQFTNTPTTTSTLILNSPTISPTQTVNQTSTQTQTVTDSPEVSPTSTFTITTTSSITPTFTETYPPTDIVAQVTKTCFNVAQSCSAGWVTLYNNSFIWSSDGSACAYWAKYDLSGNPLYTVGSPPVNGVAADAANGLIWFVAGCCGSHTINAVYENNITGPAVSWFSIPNITLGDYDYGLAFEGADLWTTKQYFIIPNAFYECRKYSTTGVLLKSFQVPPPPAGGGNYWGIAYGDGYLWLSTYGSNGKGYIRKVTTDGVVVDTYIVSNSGVFMGIVWAGTNTFWVAGNSEICKIQW
jgi:hypothetical protein